ncbi:tetratricopeptide repeat protein [Sphingomonas sp.]|uniref:tetratricopeptide repeat protein n=1 Tax=Sphingomonas sp. TaxID=28214 RepID=UPI003B3A4477
MSGRTRPPRLFATLATMSLALVAVACKPATQRADEYETLSDRAFAGKDYRHAADMMKEAVALDDSTPRRWLKLGRAREASQIYSGAAAAYQQALDLQPDNVEALQNLAVLAVRGGEYDTAQRYIEPLLLLDPDNQAGLLSSGAVALAKRNFAEVDRLATRIVEVAPQRADGYVLRARMHDMQGDSETAVRILEARAKDDPTNSDLLMQLMALYRKLGQRDGIRATAIRLMPLFPDDPRYAMEAARAYQARGDTKRAQEIIARVRTKHGGSPSVMTAIAEFWRNNAPPALAAGEIAKVAEASRPAVRVAMARTILGMGDPAATLRVLEPLTRTPIAPTNIEAHTLSARALLAAGRPDAAQAKVDEVLAFDGSNPEALIVRARLRLNRKLYREAANDAQVVMADDETNSEATLLLAEIRSREGNQVLAANVYGTARQKFPDDVGVARAEIAWLLGQKRGEEAAQRAASFLQAHRNASARQLFSETCAQTKAAACRAGAQAIAAGDN